MRTVVLRKALPLLKELRFHTDVRSNKWKELQNNNSISALFYDASTRVQTRVKGKAILHFNDALTSEDAGHRSLFFDYVNDSYRWLIP